MAGTVMSRVKLGGYRGLSVKRPEFTVSDEEVRAAFEREKDNLAEKVEVKRGLEKGDIAVVDYIGLYNGRTFENGTVFDQQLTIGGGDFFPTFDDQLEAAEAGDRLTITVEFPEKYPPAPGFASKTIVFKTTVKKVIEVHQPELADHEDALRQALIDEKTAQAESDVEDELLGQIIDASEFSIFDGDIEPMVDMLYEEWKEERRQEGFNPEKYLKVFGSDEEGQRKLLRTQAEHRLKTKLVMDAVADAEGLEATAEEIEDYMSHIAEQCGMTLALLKTRFDEAALESVKSDIRMFKALEFIKEAVSDN